jgi:hypothetical protein
MESDKINYIAERSSFIFKQYPISVAYLFDSVIQGKVTKTNRVNFETYNLDMYFDFLPVIKFMRD